MLLHLVSHASGELVEMLARNAVTQLEGVQAERRLWKRVRYLTQLPDILAQIAAAPGFVLHSISQTDLREALELGCARLHVPCQFALEPLVTRLGEHTGAQRLQQGSPGIAVDEDYYVRVEAMKYTLAHDDGVAGDDLAAADVVLVGVSRATKTPTCMYLASRGIKAANVPLVPGAPLPAALAHTQGPLFVGLTVDPVRLAKVRADRLKSLDQDADRAYARLDDLRREVLEARRLFHRRGWPVIDVTQLSIEQAAAQIIELLAARADTSA